MGVAIAFQHLYQTEDLEKNLDFTKRLLVGTVILEVEINSQCIKVHIE